MLEKHRDTTKDTSLTYMKGRDENGRKKGRNRFEKGKHGTKGKTGRTGEYGQPREPDTRVPPGEKIDKIRRDGDKFVERIYTKGDASMQALWKKRLALRAAGEDPTTAPKLFAHDKYVDRYQDSGKIKPGILLSVA